MRWIIRQRRRFHGLATTPDPRHYVSGETHRYLGQQYRLKVELGIQSSVRLRNGSLHVTTQSPNRPDRTKALLDRWYRERATEVFGRRIDAVLESFPDPDTVAPAGLLIRRLTGRWGSMTPTGRLALNLDLVKTPTPCIDYVITHELCHRIEHHHGPAFWALLDRAMPDWSARKERLERDGND